MVLIPSKCKYEEKLYWDEFNKQHTYTCKERPLPSGYCMFHDANFLNPLDTHYSHNLSRITKRFKSKLDKYIENKEDLLFIGYNLPEITIENTTSESNAYFMYAIFTERINFQRCTFNKKVTFLGSRFKARADFRNCSFSK